MAVEFPSNPTNGQTWDGWIYDSSLPGWRNANAPGAAPKTGLTPVVPTSVVVASGTASVNQLGTVTFSGASSISLNNVFTTTYKNYRITINHTGSANPTVPAFRFRASGTDNTAAAYTYAGPSTRTAQSIGNWYGSGQNSFDLGRSNSNASVTTMEIYDPTSAVLTELTFNSSEVDQAGFLMIMCNGVHSSTSQFDGFTFYAAGGGTVSGTVQVFGYNN